MLDGKESYTLKEAKAQFTRERNRSDSYRSVPKNGKLRDCVHMGKL